MTANDGQRYREDYEGKEQVAIVTPCHHRRRFRGDVGLLQLGHPLRNLLCLVRVLSNDRVDSFGSILCSRLHAHHLLCNGPRRHDIRVDLLRLLVQWLRLFVLLVLLLLLVPEHLGRLQPRSLLSGLLLLHGEYLSLLLLLKQCQ